jgi:hypothetical protein
LRSSWKPKLWSIFSQKLEVFWVKKRHIFRPIWQKIFLICMITLAPAVSHRQMLSTLHSSGIKITSVLIISVVIKHSANIQRTAVKLLKLEHFYKTLLRSSLVKRLFSKLRFLRLASIWLGTILIPWQPRQIFTKLVWAQRMTRRNQSVSNEIALVCFLEITYDILYCIHNNGLHNHWNYVNT